jgi:hypothetical protein
MCILRDLPQQKNPRAFMPGELPQFSMFPCSHDLFFSYEKEKEGRK